jgi:hypothetical protein
MKNAEMAPIRNDPTKSSGSVTAWASVSTASTPITTARTNPESTMVRRGERRSLTSPPSSMSSARGTAAAVRTAPRASDEPVICSTSQAIAT